ncbi:MAG: hypothetical protein LBH81_03650 [Rickettsiales bacterium]|jgi:hypothetical protein|nr:hypothetical protein [Rickettsiales bacterium]
MKKLLKRNLVILCAALVAALVIYRISALVKEGDREVSNIVRIHVQDGIPVETMEIKRESDALKFPLSLKSGRAFVPLEIKLRLKKGMAVSDEKITFISGNLDFDTGLYEVRVSGKLSGEHSAEEPSRGIFIPRSAVNDNFVWINSNGNAVRRKIRVAATDAERVLVAGGISDGEQLITSSTANLMDGVKVK